MLTPIFIASIRCPLHVQNSNQTWGAQSLRVMIGANVQDGRLRRKYDGKIRTEFMIFFLSVSMIEAAQFLLKS